jgi:surface protein
MADVIEITIPNGITYSLKDATAVKFVEQILTDAQKAQARKNIGAEAVADKLFLDQICGVVPNDTGTKYRYYSGFKDLLATSNTASITFTINPPPEGSLRKMILRFGDFVGARVDDDSDAVTVYALTSRTTVLPTSGKWLRVKYVANMFKNCTGLKSLDLSMFDTSDVTNMNSMFSSCSSLTALNLSTFDTSEVRNIGNMFSNCTSLATLDISSFDTSKVTWSFNFLSNCSALTTLKTPKINPLTGISLPKTMYTRSGTAYNNLPITTGTSIELRTSWN